MRYGLLCSLLACSICSSAQTPVGGIINTYTSLVGIETCDNRITVADAAGLSPGDGLLIIQMQGAGMLTSNNSTFGDLVVLNGAGNFEVNEVVEVMGNTVTLAQAPLHPYLTGTLTQVVGFPQLTSATLTAPLQAQPWNGTTGGIIALSVTDTLFLTQDIDASGSGFRGGIMSQGLNNNCTFLTNANNYSYEITNWRGAPKGESIVMTLPGAESGRGAQLHGGGGGNDHNSGGGGGALHSPGGQGGENNEPSTFGCDGPFPGLGGKALPTDTDLVFLGGGGGSGHRNNVNPSDGGNGGGIVFVQAKVVVGAGGAIRSNGLSAAELEGDGAGGGGSGGSILIDVQKVVGDLPLQARGGDGGTVDNDGAQRCHGPGGGGSGGRVVSTLALPADLLGGGAGLSLHSASCPDGTNNAQPGAMGISQSPWGGPPQGMTIEPAAIVQQPSDTIACLGEIVQLPVDVTGADLLYQWQILIEGTWTDLQEGAVHGGVQSPTLFIAGLINPMTQYRLIVTREGDCPLTLMSEPIQVSGTAPPTADPVFVLSGTEVSFTANAELTDQYLWSFGDASGTTSSEANPAFTYAGPGTYNVTLMVTNSCGTQDYGLQIVIGSAPEAAFTASRLEGCSPLEVTFTSTSTGTVDALSWSFPGGMPASSTEAAPMVSFPAPGLYIVTLIVENDFGSSEATVEVEVFPTPQVDFNFSVDGLTVSFFNASLDATTYTWNFGDGLTSTAINPVHSYGEPGVYEVTLNAQNASCGTAASKQVGVMVNQTDHPSGAPQQRIYPNPSTGLLVLEGWAGYELTVLNVHGQWLQQNQIQGDQESLQLTHLPAGVYWLRFTRAGEEVYERWVKW